MNKILLLLLILSSLNSSLSFSQTLSVGSVQEDKYRLKQLLGEVPASSFSIRPISTNLFLEDDSLISINGLTPKILPLRFANSKGKFNLLPVTFYQQYNSHHPYGWNDGAIIPAKGYQTKLSAGFFVKLGAISLQLQPEFVYAANNEFSGFTAGKTDQELKNYFTFYSFIDAPEKFGKNTYTKAFLGQSNIMLNVGPISGGISNENLWWGPGIQNALIITNNAPGFLHFSIHTNKPIKTFIGNFEGEIIGGKLVSSGISPTLNTIDSKGQNLFGSPKKAEWRYVSGLNINYQPKWVPGLSLGFIRTFMAYNSDVNKLSDFIPFFVKLQKKTGDQDAYPRDQRISFYTRWLLQKENAEIYFEYGLNDNSYNFRDFYLSPDHGRSYLFGFSKLIALNRKDESIHFNAEILQLSQSIDRLLRDAGGFYQHSEVVQGHTHNGQFLGAGTGTGGNLAGIKINWLKGLKKLGLSLDRYEHNMDYYDMNVKDLNGVSRKWVDYALGINAQSEYKNLLIVAKLQGIQSFNYQWFMKDYSSDKNYIPHNDVFNLHAELGITYRF